MATLKQRLHRKNSSGTYDTIHLETGADCITGTLAIANGGTGATTAANARTNLGAAASSHNHSAGQITSGTLPVTRGGTGVTSIDALKSALGIGGGAASQYEIYPIGYLVCFDDKVWRCVHYDDNLNLLYLGARYVYSITAFGSNSTYSGSTLAQVATNYQNQQMSSAALAYCANVTVNNVTAKVFVPSYEQCDGGFEYFKITENRIATYDGSSQSWWTSSANGSGLVWHVSNSGNLSTYNPTLTGGFRPFVALQL